MKDARADGPVVALTGMHRGESPQPGGSVAMSLRRKFPQVRLVGLGYDPMESGFCSVGGDRLDAAYLLPYPGTGAEALMHRLRPIVEREGIELIIPCLDTEIANYIAIEDDLARLGVRLWLPDLHQFEDRDKTNLAALCDEIGVPAPRTAHAHDALTLAGHAERIGYPCYVKGQLYGAQRVHTVAEFHAAFAQIHAVWGGPVLVQQAVVGEEYNVVGLGDGAGGVEGFCAIRKLMRSRLGKGFAGVVVEDPALEDLMRRVVARLNWRGPFEVEFVQAPGQPHMLFEMNPRFPAWTDFAAQIGCDLPGRLVERALGLPTTPLGACPAGRMFIRHCIDQVTDIAEIACLSTAGARDPLVQDHDAGRVR